MVYWNDYANSTKYYYMARTPWLGDILTYLVRINPADLSLNL
jgi:hypothetical protein